MIMVPVRVTRTIGNFAFRPSFRRAFPLPLPIGTGKASAAHPLWSAASIDIRRSTQTGSFQHQPGVHDHDIWSEQAEQGQGEPIALLAVCSRRVHY